ncbi:hypothetical protein MSG28_014056 [Choristoneura fumiferana]|uniref:Uncharacterized protein n=1 Tax=Choristoneura fumiferana TaxID=7141 RepID=A0ACC0JFS3_CHOFU|nr:hypothetical protein MSG28_014056 [Choristoneura fumiferana]
MAEKKIQENPLPEAMEPEKEPEMPKPKPNPDSPRLCIPSLTKTPPNDLYRRLLPAVLFLLTFVTVMTMLLIYMDTVALGAQQFRLNMSRDYELARIPQESPSLVAYVRQLHLAPRPPRAPARPRPTPQTAVLDRLLGELYNGTFVEFLPRGPRDGSTEYLEAARGWRGSSCGPRHGTTWRCARTRGPCTPASAPRTTPERYPPTSCPPPLPGAALARAGPARLPQPHGPPERGTPPLAAPPGTTWRCARTRGPCTPASAPRTTPERYPPH